MPVVPPAEGGPLRRRASDFFFEHPLDARRLVAAGSALVLVAVLGAVAWPRPADDLPTHLPFVTIPPSTTTMSAEVVVHGAGAVLRPGLYHRPASDRVADLLEAAGGPLDEADLDRLNLAEPLMDGVRIWVPSVDEPQDPLPTPEAGTGPVDRTRASASPLESLTGVGPSLAAAILDYRGRFGPFGSVDALLAVSGIGSAKLAGLRDHVRVAPTG
ncbi:MAG: helix-hairpin-helix domain-containing protein [Acidimicrobiales bacterium]|nr:helix-hairpin-helix domain-containing protein [Acidimicrobiales bacterium]